MADQYKRDQIDRRVKALKDERQTFISHYRELSEFVSPVKGRFLTTDRNRGEKRYNRIINSVGTSALRICSSGMFAGTMSPARPWFALETEDPDLMDSQRVRAWLYDVESLLRRIFGSSNFYNQAPVMLSEMIQFGTGCMLHVDDFQDVARFYTQTAGSYMIAQNNRLDVDTLAREFEWTVDQIVREFGYDNCSQSVKNQYDRGNYDVWVPLVHYIAPNAEYNANKIDAKYKLYKSCYYEPGNGNKDQFLRESGFDEFPAYCPRWSVTGDDIYGTDCPAMTALGDIRGVQLEEKRKAQAIDKMVNPPLVGPPSLRNVPITTLPGGVNIYDGTGNEKLQPVYQVNMSLNELRMDIDAVERRIKDAFYVDLFMAISDMEGIQPRNQLDITERNQERLLQLGPVLERLQGEFQNKLIDRTFNQCVRAGVIGGPKGLPIPPELSGSPIKVKYISPLAMAQRQQGTTGIERMVGFVMNMAQVWPEARDKLDADQTVDEYSQALGVPPRTVASDDVVAQRRAVQAQQQQQAEALAAAQQGADTAKSLASAKTDGSNALTNLAGALTK